MADGLRSYLALRVPSEYCPWSSRSASGTTFREPHLGHGWAMANAPWGGSAAIVPSARAGRDENPDPVSFRLRTRTPPETNREMNHRWSERRGSRLPTPVKAATVGSLEMLAQPPSAEG